MLTSGIGPLADQYISVGTSLLYVSMLVCIGFQKKGWKMIRNSQNILFMFCILI